MCSKSVAFIPINSLNSLSLEKQKHSVELGGSLVPKVCLSSKRNCNSLAQPFYFFCVASFQAAAHQFSSLKL